VSQALLDIADRYDRELDGLTKEALDRIFTAYDTSYRILIERLRTSYPRLVEAGSISTLVRQGAIAAELGEALKFIRPENEAAYQQLGEQVITEAMSQGTNLAGDTLAYIGVQAPFTTIPVGAVRNQAERFRERLVNYSDVQASSISAVVEQGLIQGWGTRKAESALKGLGVSFKSNAETVSRTEILSAYNGAARSRNEQAGLDYAMWVAAPSERMCSLCGARNGQVYKAKDLPAIPGHPRCRCTAIYYPSLSDIDQEFWAKYRQEGLDDLAAKGLKADGGLTYWEKKAGLTEAPKPVWVPGDKLLEVAAKSSAQKGKSAYQLSDMIQDSDGVTSYTRSLAEWQKKFADTSRPKPPPPPGAEEMAAVTAYTTADYKQINSLLRGREDKLGGYTESDRAGIRAAAELANRGLAELKGDFYKGTVYRGTTYSQAKIDAYKPGATVTELGFTSTSTDGLVAADTFGGGIFFRIQSKTGVSISKYSDSPDESEVLFRSGTRFKVISSAEDEFGDFVIELEEEDAD
jgi:SPP1 gp7 family putative phage head morphogenesis protein